MIAIAAALIVQTSTVQIPVIWHGPWSKVKKEQTYVAGNGLEWANIWWRHTGNTKEMKRVNALAKQESYLRNFDFFGDGVPTVDFSHYFVVAVFGGEMLAADSMNEIDCKTDVKTIVLRYCPGYFQVGDTRPEIMKRWMRSPYGFFLLPRGPETKVKLIEGIPEIIGRPITKFMPAKEFLIPPPPQSRVR